MRFLNLPGIARNSALILGLAVITVLSVNAQNSNNGSSSVRTANSNTVVANTVRVEPTGTPRSEPTRTPVTEVKTVVEKENGFPWGLLGLLGLAGLMPKKRSVEVTGVRDTTRETRTTSDNRDNKP